MLECINDPELPCHLEDIKEMKIMYQELRQTYLENIKMKKEMEQSIQFATIQ